MDREMIYFEGRIRLPALKRAFFLSDRLNPSTGRSAKRQDSVLASQEA
jgi:hypothetical protein